MNHSLLLAGLFAALVSSSAFAHVSALDQAPSPTIVYSDLVTIGSAPLGDEVPNNTAFEAASLR